MGTHMHQGDQDFILRAAGSLHFRNDDGVENESGQPGGGCRRNTGQPAFQRGDGRSPDLLASPPAARECWVDNSWDIED